MGRWRVRQRVWGLVAGATIALGLVCGVVTWGPGVTAAVATGLFVPAFCGALLMERSASTSTRIGLRFGLVAVAAFGLLEVFAWSGALLIVAVTVTSPVLRMLLRVWLRRGDPLDGVVPPDDQRVLDDLGTAPDGRTDSSLMTLASPPHIPEANRVPALDDDALCEAWRRSYVRLDASRAADARLEVVVLRQLYLDELVRRHPAAVHEWLASGARAAGNPLPFLKRPDCHGGNVKDGRQDNGSAEVG